METTVKDFFDGVAAGKLQVTLPSNMKVDINGDRCYHIEKIHKTGFRYLIVPKGTPQEGMYWRSAQPTDLASIFEEPKKVEKPKTGTSGKQTPKKETSKVEKK